jgi:hypothetical protein
MVAFAVSRADKVKLTVTASVALLYAFILRTAAKLPTSLRFKFALYVRMYFERVAFQMVLHRPVECTALIRDLPQNDRLFTSLLSH